MNIGVNRSKQKDQLFAIFKLNGISADQVAKIDDFLASDKNAMLVGCTYSAPHVRVMKKLKVSSEGESLYVYELKVYRVVSDSYDSGWYAPVGSYIKALCAHIGWTKDTRVP
jgi:hypothetical protein